MVIATHGRQVAASECDRMQGSGNGSGFFLLQGTFPGLSICLLVHIAIETATVANIYSTHVPSSNQTSWQNVAALFRSCIAMAKTNRTETEDLVQWMISLDLDLNNDTRLATVDAMDMMARCSLDFGIEVVFSIKFNYMFFVGKWRAAELGLSEEDANWFTSRISIPKERKTDDYIHLLRKYGLSSPRDELIAAKIMHFEKEMQRFVRRTTPEAAPYRLGTIESLGEMTKPYVTSEKWSTMFMRYTNLVYNGSSPISYQEYVLEVLVKVLKYQAVGVEGLRHLIAWSLFRQMVPYTEPPPMGDEATSHACYLRVLSVMKIAVVSPYLRATVVNLQMTREAEEMMAKVIASFRAILASSEWLRDTAREAALRKIDNMQYHVGNPSGRRYDADFVEQLYAPMPDVSEDRFFTSWRKALTLTRHQAWADQTTWQYDASLVNAAYIKQVNAVLLPTAILQRPFFFEDGPAALNYGGLGVAHPMARQEVIDHVRDSESLADFVGIRTAFRAFNSLPECQRNMKLPGIDMTAERLFFVNHCAKLCEDQAGGSVRYAPARSRCIVPIMNMPEFSDAFKCSLGTPMNPLKKCDFW
ncbi:hypothetical protein HPB50_018845 [Hyalomma asiaticum]|uniref:Uncharacterized protein n=1 Tax=Hyalomma asiaticum TaxID=266040 RepID=A0ACB7SGS1_HYAAI|nr:hypothetical protein HPB50_018845 [Hyalomma asiaticum]